nr:NuMA protein - human [Homo sapiens]
DLSIDSSQANSSQTPRDSDACPHPGLVPGPSLAPSRSWPRGPGAWTVWALSLPCLLFS